MSRIACVFPGQGSQKVGMGVDYRETDLGRDLFEVADGVLGFPLSRLCEEGPEEELTRTENAQPAIFTVSLIAWGLVEARGIRPERLAGHSLGEYSALAAAGVVTFEDGLRTVRRRGELMAQVADRVSGGMAAILNAGVDTVAELCKEASEAGIVEIANYNSPDQTVISGELAAVDRAIELAKERGIRRAVRLNVAAPFHSSLMEPLAAEMAAVLEALDLQPPRLPVLANVTADVVTTPEAIRDALVRQVAGSVRWTETIRSLAMSGIDTTVEVGPGRVLTGLTTRIEPEMRAFDTSEALEGLPPLCPG